MNKKPLIISLTILVLIVLGVGFLAMDKADAPAVKDNSVASDTPATTEKTTSTETSTPGTYVDYSNNVIANTKGTKLLFFHAPWCPQCRDLEASIKSDGVPSDITIIKVDYDSNQSLRREYGVTLQTSVVRIDDDGRLIKKFVAYDTPNLKSVLENLL